jgi:hypothetical protein
MKKKTRKSEGCKADNLVLEIQAWVYIVAFYLEWSYFPKWSWLKGFSSFLTNCSLKEHYGFIRINEVPCRSPRGYPLSSECRKVAKLYRKSL